MVLPKVSNSLIFIGGIILALVLGFLISTLPLYYLLVLLALIIGGLLVGVVFFSPELGFYILVISSMLNRYEIPVGGVHLRIDQLVLMPVFLGVLLHLAPVYLSPLYGQGKPYQRSSGVPIVIIVSLALYIALNALSSIVSAPQPTESFKIVMWLLLSFVALIITYLIVGRYVSVQKAMYIILGAGFVSAAIGVSFFILFFVFGVTWGAQYDRVTGYYSATGTFFEANGFGSFQAFSAVAGISLLSSRCLRRREFTWVATGTGLSTLALTLSFTRAAWLAFIAGFLILLFLQLRRGYMTTLFLRASALIIGALVALVPTGLLTNVATRFISTADFSSETIAFRLRVLNVATTDWLSSPIIGLGTNSFSQRHFDPWTHEPVYLGSFFYATLYDVGIIGLISLFIGLLTLAIALWRVSSKSRDTRQGNMALALLCGFVTLIVSYQSTNAWWYSYNWMILAVAMVLYQESRLRR